MRFIVTGGAGFIGHNVVRILEALGHECIILDNISTYGILDKDELLHLAGERKSRIRANIHRVDLTDYKSVTDYLRAFAVNCNAVIHLASFPRQKAVEKNPVWASDVMSSGLVNLLENTAAFKIPKFVYISSSMVYGNFTDGVKEDAVCRPQGQYGIMKLMGEDLVKDYSRRGCFEHVIIRPSAVYGEYDIEDRVVSKFILSALRGQTLKVNGEHEQLDFTHGDDTARGIAQAVLSDNTINKTYNITRSESHSLLEAAQLACKLAGGGNLSVNDRDMSFPSRGALNIDAARRDFDYNPQISIEEGFARYIEWFKTDTFWKKHL